jgi:hypothetical protein
VQACGQISVRVNGTVYILSCMDTPLFPAWAAAFTTQLQRLRTTAAPTLHQFESLFAAWVPHPSLDQQTQGDHSRDRCWNLRLVFWSFLWQIAQTGAACREAIRQAQILCLRAHRPLPPDQTSPYCQARAKLPLQVLEDIHQGLVAEAQVAMAPRDLWLGHHVLVIDGTTVTLPDTPANQQAYPQLTVQAPGCGLPIMRLLAAFSLATGLVTTWATGHWRQHELHLLQRLWKGWRPGEVLLGDRGFSGWAILAQCLTHHLGGVFRLHGARRADFRHGRRLGRNDRLMEWKKPRPCPPYLTAPQWAQLPTHIVVRLVRCQVGLPGWRTRQVTLVTTLLDPEKYPLTALSELYQRRWTMELTLRHLKTTLQMEHLSCKTPGNIERELRMHLLVHNLVRRLLLEAARRHRCTLERMSFAGALAAARRHGEALLQVSTQRQRRALFAELFRSLASDLVPDRPGRREPRAVKRRPKPFPLLTRHRHLYRETPHRNRFRPGRPQPRKSPRGARA